MKSLSLVVPTFNMADSLADLMSSIEQSGLIERVEEAIIVNDGSTDTTVESFNQLRENSRHKAKWTLLTLNKNEGRFKARYHGAEICKTELVLFLDSRVFIHQNFSTQLEEALKAHDCLSAVIRIDEHKSIYDLYWKRTHDWAFKKYYDELDKGLWLNPENYDQYAKGTGGFLCPQKIFMECSKPYLNKDLKSDDTLLLKSISAVTPIHITSHFEVFWHPRRNLLGFLSRLFERGPGFVEYHVFERQGLYFTLFIFSLVVFIFNLWLFIDSFVLGLGLFTLLSVVLSSSTLLFSRSIGEAIKLAPLHYLSIVSYFFGSLWGIFVVLALKIKSTPAAEATQ